jgi:peptide/nickel transport system substrate-binding protein
VLRLFPYFFIGILAFGIQAPVRAEPSHAIAMHGAPELPDGFSNFPYAMPDAPKGGRIVLGASGSLTTSTR